MTGGSSAHLSIAINGRFLTRPVSGVERYAVEILRELDIIVGELPETSRPSIIVYAPRGATINERYENLEITRVGKGGHLWEQFVLPFVARGRVLINLCNTAPVIFRRQVVCVHDANVWLMPENYSLAFRILYRTLIPLLIGFRRRWVTDSQFSLNMLRKYVPFASARGQVLSCGSEHVQAWADSAASRINADLYKNRYVLMVGSQAKNKNIDLVLQLAPLLATSDLQIYVTGAKRNSVFGKVQAGDFDNENIRWLGRVNDAELHTLYRHAVCLAFPSFYEGFGLPPLEAMAIGCPVVSSPSSSLQEVCGVACLYAQPDQPEEWLAALRKLAASPDERATLVELGHTQAAKFSWNLTALSYLGICRSIAEG